MKTKFIKNIDKNDVCFIPLENTLIIFKSTFVWTKTNSLTINLKIIIKSEIVKRKINVIDNLYFQKLHLELHENNKVEEDFNRLVRDNCSDDFNRFLMKDDIYIFDISTLKETTNLYLISFNNMLKISKWLFI